MADEFDALYTGLGAKERNRRKLARNAVLLPFQNAARNALFGTLSRGVTAPATSRTSAPAQGGVARGGGYGGYGGGGVSAGPSAADLRENENTRKQVEALKNLINVQLVKSRDARVKGARLNYAHQDQALLDAFNTHMKTLDRAESDNSKAEHDASAANLSNLGRERASIIAETLSQGAGETDVALAQQMAARNWAENQREVNRSFFDTDRSIQASRRELSVDTRSRRVNLAAQLNADLRDVYRDYQSQVSQAWGQIGNLEANNNNDSYTRTEPDAWKKSAEAAGVSWEDPGVSQAIRSWTGYEEHEATLNNSEAVNLNERDKQKRKAPEGASLRGLEAIMATMNELVQIVQTRLTGGINDLMIGHERYEVIVRALNRAVSTVAGKHQWKYYASEITLGTIQPDSREIYYPRSYTPRTTVENGLWIIDEINDAVVHWVKLVGLDALPKYYNTKNLVASVDANKFVLNRRVNPNGRRLIVRTIMQRKPTLFEYPKLDHQYSKLDYQDAYQRVQEQPERIEGYYEQYEDYLDAELDFPEPELIMTLACAYVSEANPLYQPRAMALSDEATKQLYDLMERDSHSTESVPMNPFLTPLESYPNDVHGFVHDNMYPYAEGYNV